MTHIPGSSLSPLSPPSPFQHPDQKTVYDVIYADSNPSHFYGESHLIQTGACPHLTRIKQKYKQEGEDENSILENYRSLIQYSISWHKSKQEIEKKRKHRKEVSIWDIRNDYPLILPMIDCSYLFPNVVSVLTRCPVCMPVFIVSLWDVGEKGIWRSIKWRRSIVLVRWIH